MVAMASAVPVSHVAPGTDAAPSRILSVDILRGLTIALMILVNDPGDGRHTYAQLEHATWSGLTLTDLVFPTFLFLVGASIIFSLENRLARGESRAALARNIVRRALTILLIDFFIALFPYFHFTQLRIYGVLTRIAVCYLIVGLLCLVTRRAALLFSLAIALLLSYWILMRWVPVPGLGVPTHDIPLLDPDRNLAAVIDRGFSAFTESVFHTGRLYEGTRDPEGMLSTLPAIATVLFGTLAGLWLRRSTAVKHYGTLLVVAGDATESPANVREEALQTPGRTLAGLVLACVACLAIGFAWDAVFPINKRLWTSSYVFAAAGFSLLGLSVCYGLIDTLRLERRSKLFRMSLWPWLVFGSNAITAYAVSELLMEAGGVLRMHDDAAAGGRPVSVWVWIYQHWFAHGGSTKNTSLAFALGYVALCFLPNLLLWRKRIFLKV